MTRLESALEGVRFIIDPFVPAERQVYQHFFLADAAMPAVTGA